MTVAGLLTIRVTDGDTVAVAAEPTGLDNGAATGGHNRRADGARPVHALVHPAPSSLEAGGETPAGNGLDVGGRRLGAALHDLGNRFLQNCLGNYIAILLRAIFLRNQCRYLMITGLLFLAHLGLRSVPFVIIDILGSPLDTRPFIMNPVGRVSDQETSSVPI